MIRMTSFNRLNATLATLALFTAVCAAQDPTPVVHVPNPPNLLVQQGKHYVILVSLDGFRYDYEREHGAPHLAEMAKDGVSTPDGMLPSYPSLTFPNHLTLATGLLPEHHGIVSNEFYDPIHKAHYRYSDPKSNSDGTWYQGTPIWVLAEQQGMRSACFFWPGSEAEIDDIRPTYYLHFDDRLDDDLRIRQIAEWLKLPPADRPHLITLYFSNVDHSGHSRGPDSPETKEAVHHVDAMIGKLRDAIKDSGLPVDLIVTADHGMVKTDPTPIVLDQFANMDHFKNDGQLLYADSEEAAQTAYEEFKKHPDPRFDVYRRLNLPPALHYTASAREGDPVIVTKGPYSVMMHASQRPPAPGDHGSHGYDPHAIPQMKAIFYAEGPDIAAGVKLPSFDNIDVYPFIARLLELQTPPIDGTLAPLQKALKH
jgi:alkaline phosphatase D